MAFSSNEKYICLLVYSSSHKNKIKKNKKAETSKKFKKIVIIDKQRKTYNTFV